MTATGAGAREDDALMEQWDRLSNAIDRVLTALPGQMTAASELLDAERRAMRSTINTWGIATARRTNPQPGGGNG